MDNHPRGRDGKFVKALCGCNSKWSTAEKQMKRNEASVQFTTERLPCKICGKFRWYYPKKEKNKNGR